MIIVILLQRRIALVLVEFKLAACRVAFAYAKARQAHFAVPAQHKIFPVDAAVDNAFLVQAFKRCEHGHEHEPCPVPRDIVVFISYQKIP